MMHAIKALLRRDPVALLSDTNGAALAETALVAPLLLALMIGSVEVGRFADYTIKVKNAARAGVQYGAQNVATASQLAAMQAAALADGQSVAGLTAAAQTYCTCADGTADANCVIATCVAPNHRVIYVRVDTTGTMTSILSSPLIPAALTTINVTGLAIMRVNE